MRRTLFSMSTRRVLVHFDGSRAGERAVAEAAATACEQGAALIVLVLAQVEEPSPCCNLQTTFWNAEMRRLAQAAAHQARGLLPEGVDAEIVVRETSGRSAVRQVAGELGCETLIESGWRGRPRRRTLTVA